MWCAWIARRLKCTQTAQGLEKNGRQILKDVSGIGRSRGGLSTKIHLVTADDHTVIGFSLSGGEAHDAPEGRKLLEKVQIKKGKRILVPDKAYEGDETREKTRECGYDPLVPPKNNRKTPWEYDKILYKRRNEIERYFLRIKRFRRIFTRYDKLDVLYAGFILFIILDALYCVNRV